MREGNIAVFLALHHPFADLRNFLGIEGGRLSRPSWPEAEPYKDFIRSSGLVRTRPQGGVEEWAGEELYADAALALRFPNHLEKARFGTAAVKGAVDYAFRRFRSQGTVARLEVGFRLKIATSTSAASVTEWLALLRDVLELPVRVRDANRQIQTVKLVDAGTILAQHYLIATTNHRLNPHLKPQPWWLCSGMPALVVEYSHSQPIMLPPHTRHVLDVPEADATLFHAWLHVGKQCSAWFVATGKRDPKRVRRLRIHLARLHAERECLRLVLLHIKDDNKFNLAKNQASSDLVQLYLNDTLRAIQKSERFGQDQSAMFEAAMQALGIAFEGQEASLQLMRRQVAAKVEGYIRRAQNSATIINIIKGDVVNKNIQMGNVTVNGDFNVVTADNIQNSFNKAANAEVDAELKEKLKAVAVEVANLAKELSLEDAETLSKDLDRFTDEAVSKKPRKEWYELSAKGILEAAKTVAEMAAPVTTAVKAVLALLAA
jgi:hypothetical protein